MISHPSFNLFFGNLIPINVYKRLITHTCDGLFGLSLTPGLTLAIQTHPITVQFLSELTDWMKLVMNQRSNAKEIEQLDWDAFATRYIVSIFFFIDG